MNQRCKNIGYRENGIQRLDYHTEQWVQKLAEIILTIQSINYIGYFLAICAEVEWISEKEEGIEEKREN